MSLQSDVRFPSIDGLRAFEAAARHGTFERAADELHVTASAIGKRVATVEEIVGAQLFARSGKTLALTAAGREYLDQVRAALALLAAVPLHRRAVQRITRLRVCAPPTFARQILVPALDDFAAAQPDIELEIVLSIPYVGGAAAGVDVEVRHGSPAEHHGDVLMHDVAVPMIAPALLERAGGLAAPADLARVALLRSPLEPWKPWFDAAGLDWSEPLTGPRLVDLGLLLQAAACGQGVALGRPSLARQALRQGALAALFDIRLPTRTQYYLATTALPGSEAELAAGRFSAWLREVCARVQRETTEFLSRRT